ncbi:MAG TPA: DUF4136 domain-containing protein [Ottowia sp.]|uniref:DUF4136 domain-containing protein n=1 Tax=Ottowia sp. TaxID=1898956 RepID=UPI002CC4310D|nr:DUF4136 domain-containing protein [Ottowia sp.]HMN20077.1 DUF4136 domain-containing protein [Ottowia sp.]
MIRITLVLLASLLTACASGPRIVASDVRTVAAQAPGASVLVGAHYRFEPAPQGAGQPPVARVQALAETALARAGLVRDDAQPRLAVQVAGTVQAYWVSDWGPYGGWSNPRLALGLGYGWRGGGIGLGWGGPLWDPTFPAYVTEAHVLMRDLQTGQIVYDSRARHDGTWHNTDAVLAALFVAALEGYPDPPAGPRRIDVPISPAPAQAAPAADEK